MPCFSNSGIAVSVLHVVGLQEPPKNTSHLLVQSIAKNIMNIYLENIHELLFFVSCESISNQE